MRSLGFLGGVLGGMELASDDVAGVRYFQVAGQGQPIGMVMAEKGRICWASCRISGLRLADILERDAGVPPSDLERVFQACQETGEPLGESLLAAGLVTGNDLRRALLHQTASSLVSLIHHSLEAGGQVSDFIPAPDRTYRPMFTFSASEVVAEAIEREVDLQLEASFPPMAFTGLTEHASASVCLLETKLSKIPALPVLVSESIELSMHEAARLYRNLKPVVQPPTLEAAGIQPFSVMVRCDENRGWLATYAEPHLCLFEFVDRFESVKLLSSVLHNEHKLAIFPKTRWIDQGDHRKHVGGE